MDKPLISIIVPVYKSYSFLKKCVNSILTQTYTNIECILVDDGSPDECPGLCDEIAKTDNRVKVIHKENGGVSSARNEGIRIAQGEWISFVDSDDTIDSNMILLLYENAVKNKAELSICGIKFIYPDSRELLPVEKYQKKVTSKKCVSLLKQKVWIEAGPCNKLFKKKKLDGIYFNLDFHFGEDTVLLLDYLSKIESVYIDSTPCYNYLQNVTSLSHTYSRDITDFAYYLLKKYNKVSFYEQYSKALVVFIEYFYSINTNQKLRKIVNKYLIYFLTSSCFSFRSKIAFLLYKFFPNLYRFIKY